MEGRRNEGPRSQEDSGGGEGPSAWPGCQTISSVSRKKVLEATTVILRPLEKQQVPGRKQVPTGFILRLSLLQVLRLRTEEEERSSSYLEVGAAQAQSQLGSRTHLDPPLHFAGQTVQCLQQGDSQDTGLSGWGAGKRTSQPASPREDTPRPFPSPLPVSTTPNMEQ